MLTLYMDQVSEHQRDLTNSASSRFAPELMLALYLSTSRMNKALSKLVVDGESMKRNFEMNSGMICAEPLYILLARHGHPDAHEHVRRLALKAQREKKPFSIVMHEDTSLKPYFEKFSSEQKELLLNPEKYIGLSAEKTEKLLK